MVYILNKEGRQGVGGVSDRPSGNITIPVKKPRPSFLVRGKITNGKFHIVHIVWLAICACLISGCGFQEVPVKASDIIAYGKISSGEMAGVSLDGSQEPFSYDFTESDLLRLQRILDDTELVKTHVLPDRELIYYTAEFYDTDGNGVLSVTIVSDGRIFAEGSYCVNTPGLASYFEQIIF